MREEAPKRRRAPSSIPTASNFPSGEKHAWYGLKALGRFCGSGVLSRSPGGASGGSRLSRCTAVSLWEASTAYTTTSTPWTVATCVPAASMAR
eukprot:jgi/Chrpa1/27272/Chrysochromulina_OHIO_Genome00010549-RA